MEACYNLQFSKCCNSLLLECKPRGSFVKFEINESLREVSEVSLLVPNVSISMPLLDLLSNSFREGKRVGVDLKLRLFLIVSASSEGKDEEEEDFGASSHSSKLYRTMVSFLKE